MKLNIHFLHVKTARVFTSILGDGSREGDGHAYFDHDFNPPYLVSDGFGDRGRRLDRPRLGGDAHGRRGWRVFHGGGFGGGGFHGGFGGGGFHGGGFGGRGFAGRGFHHGFGFRDRRFAFVGFGGWGGYYCDPYWWSVNPYLCYY